MKSFLKNIVQLLVQLLIWFGSSNKVGIYFVDQYLNRIMQKVHVVSHDGLALRFAAPNSLCDWRAQTFSSKEPETLEWIDSIPEGAVLWDVGANVGLYSVYAAKKRNCRVYSFEPSVFNLEQLARNIFLNSLTEKVCVVPLALSDRMGTSALHMTSTEWGGALSTFGEEFGWDGEKIRQVFQFQTVGLSMDDAVHRLSIPKPDFIKMDVDGLEHLILHGGSGVLSAIKGILIEVNDDFHEQAEGVQKLLATAGLVMKGKRHS